MRHSLKRESGVITICDPGADKPLVELPTHCCVHCGQHWVAQPGSGKIRGFCGRCNGFICGPKCAECIPQEAYCEIIEGTRNPTAVSVAAGGEIGGSKLWVPQGR